MKKQINIRDISIVEKYSGEPVISQRDTYFKISIGNNNFLHVIKVDDKDNRYLGLTKILSLNTPERIFFTSEIDQESSFILENLEETIQEYFDSI